MKTHVNGIPQIQAPCPWRRFGRSSEKRRSGETRFCMLILISILIVSLKDVLSQTDINRKSAFCILGQYSAEQYDAQIFGKSVLLRLLVIEIWVSWHFKKEKGLSSYWRASNTFAWAPTSIVIYIQWGAFKSFLYYIVMHMYFLHLINPGSSGVSLKKAE